MMKKSLFVILLILCSCGACPVLHAQISTTSSPTYQSTTALPISAFRSTSSYSSISISYSTVPMRVATGSVSTVASQLSGGVLADEGYYTENVLRGPRKLGGIGGGGIAPPDTPIGEGWDVALLLALLCVGYVVRRYLTLKQVNDK